MAPVRFEEPIKSSPIRRVARNIATVFNSLEEVPYFKKIDKAEFNYFHKLFLSACTLIDARINSREIIPWLQKDLDTLIENSRRLFPRGSKAEATEQELSGCFYRKNIRIGIFIGSFDPFQMTHLETALRFLSNSSRPADLVLIVPEGACNRNKPNRSDYAYRYDILERQIKETFSPLLLPLDIGEGQDTIGIISRLLYLFAGHPLTLTHVLGSDTLPIAAQWYPEDLDVWQPKAKVLNVSLDFGSYVIKRDTSDDVDSLIECCNDKGISIEMDHNPIKTPSSSQLRDHGVFTIIFPTEQVIEKLEVVFRYGMHRNWLKEKGCMDYEI